ncbi:MAG: KTSC domain-containing protein [Nitrospiraceae bacterium]
MKPIAVDSTSLEMIAFDADRQTLQIRFRDQTAYRYLDVPVEVYQALLSAPSKGSYFNRAVRGCFVHVRLGDSLS